MYSIVDNFDECSEIDKICDHLYLGSIDGRDPELLESNDIRHVIGLLSLRERYLIDPNIFSDKIWIPGRFEVRSQESDLIPKRPDNVIINQVLYNIEDDHSSNILGILEPIERLVESIIEKKENVLIHCRMGISRSASIILALLMSHPQWISSNSKFLTYDEAYRYVVSIRPIINPNSSFVGQLRNYESTLIQ